MLTRPMGITGGGVSSLSMIVRENGGEVSLSVNNVAPMYAANFAELDGQNIGGALVSIKPAPSTPAGSNPGDNDVAFELHLDGMIEYVEIGGELVYIDHICLQYAGSNDGGTGGTGGTGGGNGGTGIMAEIWLIREEWTSPWIRMQWPFIRTRSVERPMTSSLYPSW